MNYRLMLAAIAFSAGLGSALPAQAAKLYKWVDADGNVTYSQQKPPDREVETIRLRSATISDEGAQEKLDALTERAEDQADDREFQASHASAVKDREERLASNCKIAKENMRILRTNSRIQAKDAEGNAYFLDESAIKAKMDETQRQIDANCN